MPRRWLYTTGLLLTTLAAWLYLRPPTTTLPTGTQLAIILLLTGIGIMITALARDRQKKGRARAR